MQRPDLMTTLRRGTWLVAIASATTLAGCGLFQRDEDPGSASVPDAEYAATRPVIDERITSAQGNVPGVLQPIARPILQGPLPLIYLVESSGTLRISNVDTGEEITTIDVQDSQILRVEPRGIILGSDVVLGATLAPGIYALTPLSDTAGVVRSTQVRETPTVPEPPAATQPTMPDPAAPPN